MSAGSIETLYRQAVALHQRGQWAEADRLYRLVLDRDRRHGGAVHHLGVLAYQRGYYQQAERLITQAIMIDPHGAALFNNLALAVAAQNKLHAAEAALETSESTRQ